MTKCVYLYVTLLYLFFQLPELLQSSSYQLTHSQHEALSRQLQQQLVHHSGLHVNLYNVCMHVQLHAHVYFN